jgi:hypothetical protein
MPYNPEVGDIICERLSEGQSIRKICASDGMPWAAVLFRWLRESPEFAKQYAQAREAQADALFDETLDIADETKEDYVKRLNFDGPLEGWEVNGEAIARSKLRIDTRKWMAAKLRPKKYGEKIEVDQTIGVTDALGALLGRVSEQGQRLVPMIEAPEAEDDNPEG